MRRSAGAVNQEVRVTPSPASHPATGAGPKSRTHYLYIAVIAAVVLGALVGLVAPDAAVELKPLGTGFVALIKMMIQPVIFCTIVLGVGSVASAARVGKVGGLALGYFLSMSTVALAIGLVVGNLIKPGEGLRLDDAAASAGQEQAAAGHGSTVDFLLGIIPDSMLSSLTSGEVRRDPRPPADANGVPVDHSADPRTRLFLGIGRQHDPRPRGPCALHDRRGEHVR